jgi:hypothetical protein
MDARRGRGFADRRTAMTLKQKFLLIWLLAVLAIGFAAHHFLGAVECVFQNLLASEILGLHGIAMVGVILMSAHIDALS